MDVQGAERLLAGLQLGAAFVAVQELDGEDVRTRRRPDNRFSDLDRDAAGVVDVEVDVAVEAWVAVLDQNVKKVGRRLRDRVRVRVRRRIYGADGAVAERRADARVALGDIEAARLLVFVYTVITGPVGRAAYEAFIDLVQREAGVDRARDDGAADAQRIAEEPVADAKRGKADDQAQEDSAPGKSPRFIDSSLAERGLVDRKVFP